MSPDARAVIYIASPYTKGDTAANVAAQMDAAHQIMDAGHTPYAPLLSHYLHVHRQRPYGDWMQVDYDMLMRCDVLWRLPGESEGADQEVAWARALEIPVAYSFDDAIAQAEEMARIIDAIERKVSEAEGEFPNTFLNN